jgi:hypothetical protein
MARQYTLKEAEQHINLTNELRGLKRVLDTLDSPHNVWFDCGEFKIDIKISTGSDGSTNTGSYIFRGSEYANHDSEGAVLTRKFRKAFKEIIEHRKKEILLKQEGLGREE